MPQHSALHISGTVWWFRKPVRHDENAAHDTDNEIAYPTTKHLPCPDKVGSDLLGRVFPEPELGPCLITKLGPIMKRKMLSRAQTTARANSQPTALGTHHTLYYRCLATQEEHYSSVDEIVQWITTEPLLQRPANNVSFNSSAPTTQTGRVREQPLADLPTTLPAATEPATSIRVATPQLPIPSDPHYSDAETPNHPAPSTASITTESEDPARSISLRKRKTRDFLQPELKGKAYSAQPHVPRKQRVLVTWIYPEKQSVTMPDCIRSLRELAKTNHDARARYKAFWMGRQRRNTRMEWWDLSTPLPKNNACALVPAPSSQPLNTSATDNADLRQPEIYDSPMPKPCLPPVFPSGPLNLNPDGSTSTYKKLYVDPNATNWEQADAEEMERLFTSETIRPIMSDDIPEDKKPTYVNPVCSEKLKDDGALKFRTRATIGGDRIDYPYSTTAITAELEAIKILLNAMISDYAQFSTIDLEDFYLGTSLPFPEFIRIPAKFIPKKIIAFYKRKQFIQKGTLYCAVLKTHYGLPQVGALSQE